MLGEAVIIIPHAKNEPFEKVRAVIDTAQEWSAEQFGGFTSHVANGGWFNRDTGQMEYETVTVLTVAVECTAANQRHKTLERIVNMVGGALKQDCVYYKEPFKGRVTLVPTAKLWQSVPEPVATAPMIAAE